MIPTHKPSYFKDFHALGISKTSLRKQALGEHIRPPFNFLRERSWKRADTFSYPIKFKALTLAILEQLLFLYELSSYL